MRNERELKGRLHVSKKIIIHLHFHVFDHPLLFSTLKYPILYSRNKTIGQINMLQKYGIVEISTPFCVKSEFCLEKILGLQCTIVTGFLVLVKKIRFRIFS